LLLSIILSSARSRGKEERELCLLNQTDGVVFLTAREEEEKKEEEKEKNAKNLRALFFLFRFFGSNVSSSSSTSIFITLVTKT
jgi:hypothetical protein